MRIFRFLGALRRRLQSAAVLAVSAAVLAGCAATGGPLGLSQAQEQALGQQQHPQILAEFGGPVNDPALTAYVQRVFDRVIAGSPEAGNIQLTVLDSPVVNAMAVPGYVYVTRGLLALANTEAELAGVLGHEIGHITERHIARRVSRGNMAGIGAALAGIFTGSEQVAQLAGQAGQLYVLNYSRDQEFEADSVGVQLLARAGYDPLAEADFLGTLGAWSSLQSQITGRSAPPEYLSSHPNSADRVRRAAETANVIGLAGQGEDNRAAYLNAIDGLLYGDDPAAQGYIQGRDFIHPNLGFAFTAPSGFELQNTSQAVLGRSQNAQLQFTSANYNGSPANLIAGPLSQSLKLNLGPAQNLTVSGRPAAVGQARANSRSGAVDVTAYAVQWQANSYWIFVWANPASQSGQLAGTFRQSVQSLRPVNRASLNVPKPREVDVVTVQRSDSVSSLARYMAFDDYKEPYFRVFNGLGSGGGVSAGQRVKLIR